jgi:filamentous hemagglutinin family protein
LTNKDGNNMIHKRTVSGLMLFAYLAQLIVVPAVMANPTGPTVVGGQAAVSGLGTAHVTIAQASQHAIINWQQFNIAPNEVTRFIQPNVQAIALNRIFDQNPSQIFGTLQANGTVILLNPNGIMFGPNAQVNVGGLIASSLNLSSANFLAGHYLFQGTGLEGWVKNAGTIQGQYGGVYLLAPNVENSGVITSPGGNIVLAAGTTAYLSNRPDGRGFLAELSNPTGQAVNLKDLIADGGNITLAGRVVNQVGLIQANSVRERQGKIEIYASETLTLKSGSRTIAKGGSDGLSDGGTIIAIADKGKGTAKFENGATVDVSGGVTGGHAGFVELSGSRVGLGGRFIGTANAGFHSGRLLIDPTMELDLTGFTATGFADIAFETPRDAFGNFLPDYDLRVTGFFDLNSIQPRAGGGTIKFDAGRDLLFTDLFLWNNIFGSPAKWNIVGLADRNIQLTRSTLANAFGGNIDLVARTGNVNLIDSQTGALSTVRTQGGGGITIKTGQDLIASTGFDQFGGSFGVFNVQGIYIDGPGKLNLDVGRDFIGGPVDGVPRGPGFVLWNTDTSITPQHVVNVQGKIGETNLTLGPDGLPLTVGQLRAMGKPAENESTRRYADFALSGGELSVTAGGNIYLSRIRDAGLVGGADAQAIPRDPQFAAGLENTKVSIVSRNGNILINTDPIAAGRPGVIVEQLGSLLPASFEARADNGTIQIRSDLKFLPSPTGNISFIARDHIQGVPKTGRFDDTVHFDWLYVGYQGSGGQWVAYDKRTVSQHPELWPFLGKNPPAEAGSPPVSFPDFAKIDSDLNPPVVKLLEISPAALVGNPDLASVSALVNDNRPMAAAVPTSQGVVTFKTTAGDISKLILDLVSRPFKKEIVIDAGRNIEQFRANIFLPDLGTTTQTLTEHVALITDPVSGQLRPIAQGDVVLIRDPISGAIRPWNKIEAVAPANLVNVTVKDVTVQVQVPKVSATVRAGQDIILNKSSAGEGGLQFIGQGTVRVIAKRDLDLADGRGILLDRSQSTDQGGLLDISVGRDLNMVTSRIYSRNGAGISIHGYDEANNYLIGYDNSKLYPLQLPESLRGGINLPAVGGKVNVGANTGASQFALGEEPTGIQVIQGGSVGQMAQKPIVNPDGTVTVNVVKDPAAVLIRATGNVEVNKSRIATFRGGDIRVTSLQGEINAGSGSKNERVLFPVDEPQLDSQGNPIINPVTGEPFIKRTVYEVPGSGIFTFHPKDPQPLVFPTFNDPEVNALLAEANRQSFFGRDVSALNARANQLRTEREAVFNETIKKPFFETLKLGDITLTAERGNIIIPEAGIRGRNVELIAPNGKVDFRGGQVSGNVSIFTAALTGSVNIGGLSNFSGGATPPPIAPLSGGGAAAASSTTAVASSTSAKSAESIKEAVDVDSGQNAQTKQTASKKTDEKSQLAKSVRVKRGVVIQVDVKPAS